MKHIQTIISLALVTFIVSITGTTFTSCEKETIHDTTVVVLRDTVTITDTVTIRDSLAGLNEGLVAYYNFNNRSLKDSSGHENHIVFSNAIPAHDRFGNPDNAYRFDGTSSYMRVKNSASLNPQNITLFAIVRVNDFYQGACHGNQILSKGKNYAVDGLYELGFQPYNNLAGSSCLTTVDYTKEVFSGVYGDNIPQGTAPSILAISDAHKVYVQKDQWYTVAFTYDGSTAKFYINGALAKELPNSNTVTFSKNNNDLYIGKLEDSQYSYFFNGTIDEIRIYNRAITPEQVGYLRTLQHNYLQFQDGLVY